MREIGPCGTGSSAFGRPAGVATALAFDWRKVSFVPRVPDIEAPMPRVKRARARLSRRRDTVEQITSVFYSTKQIKRVSNTQKVPRFFLREQFIHPAHRISHIFLVERPPDTKAVESASWRTFCQKSCAFLAQILKSSPLHNAENSLRQAVFGIDFRLSTLSSELAVPFETPLCPPVRSLHRLLLIFI